MITEYQVTIKWHNKDGIILYEGEDKFQAVAAMRSAARTIKYIPFCISATEVQIVLSKSVRSFENEDIWTPYYALP